MAIEVKIADQVLCATFHGEVGIGDLLEFSEAARQIETESGEALNYLTDLSAVKSTDLDFGAIQEFAAIRMTLRLKNRVKSAVVAPRPLQLGFARMYQTLSNHPQINLQIFKDRETAWAWLKADNELRPDA